MSYLIYGAYGYTGSLIAEEAVRRGHEPLLAGRNEQKLREVAAPLGLDTRVIALDDAPGLRAVLDDVPAVLHCAGPFVHTAAPMVAACLDTGTHYLDVTGEIPVLETLQGRDAEAEDAGVLLLPSVGFDVVPTDCLARALSEELPSATTLEIAFVGKGGVSQGTLKTAVEQMGMGGRVRREGEVVAVPPGWATRTVAFDDHPRTVISIPWGDVATAGVSTDVPNVTVYTYMPALARRLLRWSRYVQGVLGWEPLQALLKRLVERGVPNPGPEVREQGRTHVWASVRAEDGERRTARLRGPHAYTLTARTAVEAIGRVVETPPALGYQTPATAFGVEFLDSVEGIEWVDRPGEETRSTSPARP
jgi:saccharopine dehydrogenase (NAD+, L-lysine-forming)